MFCLNCFKYFVLYYVNFGLLPLLFEKLNLNELQNTTRLSNPLDTRKNKLSRLFSTSMFAGGDEIEKTLENEDRSRQQIYKDSEVVKEVKTKKSEVNFANLLNNYNN